MNEELRSATEELETSKEELQSVNEVLTTVNFELKRKVEETAKVNDDLSNLIASMSMATVFVDREVRIRGLTPLATRAFNILATDVGRPLRDLTHRLRYEGLVDDVAEVLETLRLQEREVRSTDGGLTEFKNLFGSELRAGGFDYYLRSGDVVLEIRAERDGRTAGRSSVRYFAVPPPAPPPNSTGKTP